MPKGLQHLALAGVTATLSGLGLCAGALAGPAGFYTLTGMGLSEDFDSIGALGTSAPGDMWEVLVAGTELGDSLIVPTGGVATGAFNGGSFAGSGFTGPTSDRSLGVVASGAGDARTLTTRVRNQTGENLTQIEVLWDLEKWVHNANKRAGGFKMEYSIDGTSWTPMPDTFKAVIKENSTPVSGGWIDGNETSRRDVGGVYDLPETVHNGSEFFLRWNGKGVGGGPNREVGMAIDNVRIGVTESFVPAGGPIVLSIAGLALIIPPSRRRDS